MTGLFHRLAQKVMGPEPPRVRSIARLPFAIPATPEVDAKPLAVAGAAASIDRLARPRGAAGEHVAQPLLPMPDAQPKTIADVARRGNAPAVQPSVFQAGPLESHTAPNARGSAQVSRAAALPVDAPRHVPARMQEAEAPETAALPPAPQLLFPEFPTMAHEPRGTPVARSASERRADAEPPEVHVHIGRIEVVSRAEPQPQRREPAQRREPSMSLEDYLAKRRKGG